MRWGRSSERTKGVRWEHREGPHRYFSAARSDCTSMAIRSIDPLLHTMSIAQRSTGQYVLAIALLIASVLVGGSQQAVAQVAIPDNIPDGSSSPPEEQRKHLKERHRDVVSRFFTGGQFSAAPAWSEGASAFGFQLEAGFSVGLHDALYLTFGARDYIEERVATEDRRTPYGPSDKEPYVLLTANYEVGLERYVDDSAFAHRAVVDVGIGFAGGDGPGMLSVEIGPKYVVPIDSYWSLPIGIKIGQSLVGAGDAQLRGTFVGVSIGVKRFYGHRDVLR